MPQNNSPLSLLILSGYFICPPTSGGAMRMINPFLRLNKIKNYQVTYLVQHTSDDELNRTRNFFKTYPAIKVISIRNKGPWCHNEEGIQLGIPIEAFNFMELSYYLELDRLLHTEHFDVIQVEHSWMSWVVPLIRKITENRVPIVLDIHNIEFMLYERWLKYCKGSEYIRIKNRLDKMRSWEQDVWSWYDAGFSVSPIDSEIFNMLTENRLRVWELPTGGGADMRRFSGKEWATEYENHNILYLGTMEWYPNVQGIRWFIDNVMPLIKQKHPDIHLYIAGFGKPFDELLSHISGKENIKFLGPQEDERDLLKKSKVFIVPLWIAAGARVKILTAWAAGIPIVATTIGAEGLAYTNGENILVTDDPAHFADNVCNIIENPDMAMNLSTSGRALVKKLYSLDIAAEKYDKAYTELISQSRPGGLRRDANIFIEKERAIRHLMELKADIPVIMNYDSITRAMAFEKAISHEPAETQVNMQNSFTWRIFRSINRTTNSLFPRGTRRQHYLELVMVGLTVIHDEGWRSFFKKAKRYVQN